MAAAPARPHLGRRRELRQAWELLANLTKKEVKVRYKGSFLGIAWSLITPLLMTAIFSVVFATFLRIPVHDFAAFFLSGYLIWQFYANSVSSSVGAIVSNGSLIKKVYFPREVLPVSLVLSQAFHLAIALIVVSPLFLYMRDARVALHLPAVAVGIVLLVAFTIGMAMLFAALNVTFRDLQELTQVIFMAWFYGTPIIYPFYLVTQAREQAAAAQEWVAPVLPYIEGVIQANPMFWFVQLFQRSLYGTALEPEEVVTEAGDVELVMRSLGPSWPELHLFGICAAWAVGMLALGWWLFRRRAVTFAKEV